MKFDKKGNLITEGCIVKCKFQYRSFWQTRTYKVILDEYTGIWLLGKDFLDIDEEAKRKALRDDLLYVRDLSLKDGSLNIRENGADYLAIQATRYIYVSPWKESTEGLTYSHDIEIIEQPLK